MTTAEKSATQVGRAVTDVKVCIISTDKVECTACSKICPTGAVTLVGQKGSKRLAIDQERCTGCGACEYVCPVRPLSAIHVEGNLEHRRI
ncbi:MAG: 4Fe-4S dicluster domain-containing protein [Desulfovibrio sp.]|nr:4Fe-4S dicluster domain-containing protein [Desulfovibrio sp.]